MASPVRLAVYGANGRMGRRVVALASADDGLEVVAALTRDGDADAGRDAGVVAGVGEVGVALVAEWPAGVDADVLVDFSLPEAAGRAVELARSHKTALVVGTTGLDAVYENALDATAQAVPVLQAANFSLVVNVLWKLAADAAQLLGPDYDIEVLEAHHRYKRDAPSGTALELARRLCVAAGLDPEHAVKLARHGDDPREPGQVTVQTLRLGDAPGEHTAYFAAPGERLELRHVSNHRDSYALGALRAAKWIAGRPAGRYAMADVLEV